MNLHLKNINIDHLNCFRYKKLYGDFLLTNDMGEFFLLKENEFLNFVKNKLSKGGKLFNELNSRNFYKNSISTENIVKRYRDKNSFLWNGPSLHIVVLTLRCNHQCVYCQASAGAIAEDSSLDMDKTTAKKVVDSIFDSPSRRITIEFQGGEPLANWETLKYIVNYALLKNKKKTKELEFTLVSNFSLLNNEKLDFLSKKKVLLCASLDGPKHVHDKNRFFSGKSSSYLSVISWIKKVKKINKGKFLSGALCTLSRYSLDYSREIIDEYIDNGFREIHLRPLTFLGQAKKNKNVIGYSAQEFIEFYKKALDYIIELNLKGKINFKERTARIFLQKIFDNVDPNYYDLRSPCGAGIGQMVYNYDGNVFPCDESRMFGDGIFNIGNVNKSGYKEFIGHENIAVISTASCLETLACDYCVYKPYCGVCPVLNLSENNNIFTPSNYKCSINKGVLDYLFLKLRNKDTHNLLLNWIN